MLERKDLFGVFEEIEINTGKLSKKNINEWKDIDDPAMKNFLDWFNTFVNKDNIIPAQEQLILVYIWLPKLLIFDLSFNNLSLSDSILTGTKYEYAINEVELQYPGIFNVEENLFQMDVLRDELEMYKEDALNLDSLLYQNQELNKKIKIELTALTEQEGHMTLKKKEAEEQCLALADNLEETNRNVQKQVIKYVENLSAFDSSNKPKFITNMPLDAHINYFNDIQWAIVNLLKSEQELSANFEVTLGVSMNLFNKTGVDHAFEEMQNRIMVALRNACILKSQRDGLLAALRYLEQVDFFEISTRTLQGSSLYQLEGFLISKREQLKDVEMNVKVAAQESAKKYINLPKLFIAQKEIKQSMAKLKHLTEVNGKLKNILIYLQILQKMLDIENRYIKMTDEFFLKIFQYSAYDLSNCQMRSNMMSELIQSYPIESKYKLLDDLYVILTSNEDANCTFDEVTKIVRQFRTECKNIERKIYIEDFDPIKTECEKIDTNLNSIKKLFIGPTTASTIIIPYEIITLLKELEDTLIDSQRTMVEYMVLPKEANKKLSDDKWFKMRRQLWMYFMQSPNMVQSCILQIEEEVSKRKHNIK